MRKSKIILALLITLCIVSVLSIAAFAEPEETTEPTESSEETSEETTEAPGKTCVIVVSGNKEAVKVYFNGSETPADRIEVPEGSTFSFRYEMNTDWELVKLVVNGARCNKPGDTYEFETVGDRMALEVTATYTGEVTSEPTESSDESGETSGTSDDSSDTSDDSSDTSDVSGETSDDSSEEPEGIPFRVTITGPGTVTVDDTVIANGSSGSMKQNVYLPDPGVSRQVTVKLAAAYGYRISSIVLDGKDHSLVNQMVLNVDAETTVSVIFAPEQESPGNYNVRISCTNIGGYVSAGGFEITQGSSKTISVGAGGSLTISVIPSEGYEIDSFTVGGQVRNLNNRTYVISNIAADTTVTVSFKQSTVVSTTVEASDLNWTADADGVITLSLEGKTSIGKSVFDKINTLSQANGQYVLLKTDYIAWYIPCGAQVSGVASDPVKLTVAMNANSSQYSNISGAFLAQSADAIFNLYEVNGLPTLPDGTLVSYNMLDKGISYKGNTVIQYSKQTTVKDGQSKTSLVPSAQTGKVGEDGWTSRMPFANSNILIACIQPASSYTIRASVQGVGGIISPSGENTVNKDGEMAFHISADTGYIISAVYVDGTPVASAATQTLFTYTFTGVTADHSISVSFIPAASDYTVSDGVAVLNSESDDENGSPANVGLIVSLIVIAIAVIGAAALFIVKYRKERF